MTSKPTLRIYYRRKLNMTDGKLAAQCVHAAAGLMHDSVASIAMEYRRCLVLGCSERTFQHLKQRSDVYVVTDTGKTEVAPNTETALAYWEFDDDRETDTAVTEI